MLSQQYPLEHLRHILIPRETWRPHPTIEDRNAWTDLPEPMRQACLKRGRARLDFVWPPMPAQHFIEFIRNGNRADQSRDRGVRRSALSNLVVAECIAGEGQFLDDMANGIWTTCEESYWGNVGALGIQKAGHGFPDTAERIVELFTAETAALLAWTWYLLGNRLDAVSPLIRKRIAHEVKIRVLDPCLARDDFWWMGFRDRRVNNWNPWINSNWLTCVLLMEDDPERRLAAVDKSIRSLDNFIDPYPKDGGCDEGPGYWGRAGASLFDCLELLNGATGGGIDVYDDPLIKDIGRFIYRVQIADRYFVNFADAPALTTPSAFLTFRYGKRIGDPQMMALGAWAAEQQDLSTRGGGDSMGRLLPALFNLQELQGTQPAQPLPRETWLSEIQVVAARDRGGSPEGFFVAAKGGHNAESHNHNDVGNVVVYTDGKPVLIDAGVGACTKQTFSNRRYEIWTMQSAYHNLPTVNGVTQQEGESFAARSVTCKADDAGVTFSLDIAGAYPPEARIKSWVRTVVLDRGKEIVITDAYDLDEVAGDLTLTLLTPCAVTVDSPGSLTLNEKSLSDDRVSGSAHIHYDAAKLTAHVEEIVIDDRRLQGVWGERLTRILLKAEHPQQKDTLTLRITR